MSIKETNEILKNYYIDEKTNRCNDCVFINDADCLVYVLSLKMFGLLDKNFNCKLNGVFKEK